MYEKNYPDIIEFRRYQFPEIEVVFIKQRYGFLLSEFKFLHLENICYDVEQALNQQEEVFLFLGKPVNSSEKSYRNENIIYNLAKSLEFKGFISFSGTLGPFGGEDLSRRYLKTFSSFKMVLIDDKISGISSITLNNYHSSQSAVRHLFEHGIRRFAYINGPKDNCDAIERINGVKDYLKEKNIELEDVFEGDFTLESGVKVVRSYFENRKQLPEAFVCANDEMAIGVFNALKYYGIKVPKDILLVGFDNTDAAEYLECPLTTINQPYSKMVLKGLDIIRDNTLGSVMFPGELIIRESCGCESPIKKAEEEYFEKKTFMEKYQLLQEDYVENLNLQAALSVVDDEEQLIENLKSIFINYKNFEFHICLFYEKVLHIENSLEFTFPETMNCYFSIVNGEFNTNMQFRTELIIPESLREKSATSVFLVYPLRMGDSAFGYIVCNTRTAYDLKFVSFKDLLNVALNRIEMQRKLNYYRVELETLSYKDPLTGVYNRRGFHYFAEPIFRENIAKGLCPAIIYCDVDHLKQINDIYGHAAGDYVIKETSNLLKEYFPNEIVARVGGDEYIVFISDFSDYDEVHILNELKKQVRKKDEDLKKQLDFQLSFGLCVYDSSRHVNMQAVIEEADSILYEFRKKSR